MTEAQAPSRNLLQRRLIFLALFTVMIGVFVMVYRSGQQNAWVRMWGVWPEALPVFFDLRQIEAGTQALDAGLNPYYTNPTDPLQRLFNYPPVWLAMPFFGEPGSSILPYGFLMLALFGAAASFLIRQGTWKEVGVLLLAIFSPAICLGMDRANSDILMFAMVVCWLLLASTSHGGKVTLGWGVGLAACMLKLFPVAAVGAFLSHARSRKTCWRAGVFLTLFAGYVLSILGLLSRIREATPDAVFAAYGYRTLPRFLWVLGYRAMDRVYWENFLLGLSLVLGLLGVGIGAWIAFRGKKLRDSLPREPDPESLLYLGGAAVFGFTFLLGGNFNYRLVFLLLAFPLLWRVVRMGGAWRVTGVGQFALILGLLWFSQVWVSLSLFLTYPMTLILFFAFAVVSGLLLFHFLFPARRHES